MTTTAKVTPSTTKFSRPTAASRRKYLTRTTTKSLESQETTPKPKQNRFEFVSRRPPFLRRTFKPKVTTTITSSNNIKEYNENTSILENDSDGKPLEIRDVVVALKNIQNAPLPSENIVLDKVVLDDREKVTTVGRQPIKITTTEVLPTFKASDITFTTSQPSNRFKLVESTQKSNINKLVTTNPPRKTPINSPVTHAPQYTFAYTSPFVSELYPSDIINRIHHPLSPNQYSDEYGSFQNTHLNYQVGHTSILDQLPEHSKVLVHSNGLIECLDQGTFPHPIYCKKFISCAKMENGKMLGWEYTCPKNLSFDPIGGICNWSADLGCDKK